MKEIVEEQKKKATKQRTKKQTGEKSLEKTKFTFGVRKNTYFANRCENLFCTLTSRIMNVPLAARPKENVRNENHRRYFYHPIAKKKNPQQNKKITTVAN